MTGLQVAPPMELAQIRAMQIANPILPGRMTAGERLAEIADILAVGLVRLRARKSTPLPRDRGESSLDFSPDQSGHVVVQDSVGDAS
jgi:hypothetical protein